MHLSVAVAPKVLSAPSSQTLQALDESGGGEVAVGVVECQVSKGTQLIEWWRNNSRLALLNLTYDRESRAAAGGDDQDSFQSPQQGMLIL